MNRPQTHEYPIWAETYISKVEDNVMEVLENQAQSFPEYLRSLEHIAGYAYAPGKWTITEMAGHIIDTERILVYRLTAFARAEEQALPGFDEDAYVASATFSGRSLDSLAEEFALLRKANLFLFKSLNETELDRSGTASGRQINVRSLLFVIAGHLNHHIGIIKERYL